MELRRVAPTVGDPQAALEYPVRFAFERNASRELFVRLNRYRASREGWLRYDSIVGSDMKDTYGMPHGVPIGMAPTSALTGMSTFVSNAHLFGNEEWGGDEADELVGLRPEERLHNTFVDVEPVSGRPFRSAKRHQLNVRVERSSLFPKLMSARCEVPTREFSPLGFGCFMYVPVYWIDDSVVYDRPRVREHVVQYQEEPERVALLVLLCLTVGLASLAAGCGVLLVDRVRERRFRSKIYVD
eukprot:scaffold1130_cov195-Pinguiococcus_pyrenoidosus.AAC.65